MKNKTSIVLVNMGLLGLLPNGIGFFEKLVDLNVSHNNIAGALASRCFAVGTARNSGRGRKSADGPCTDWSVSKGWY
jgi:hypothetical protein